MKLPILWPILSAGWWLIALSAACVLSCLWRARDKRTQASSYVLAAFPGLIGLSALKLDSEAKIQWGSIPVSPAFLLAVILGIGGAVLFGKFGSSQAKSAWRGAQRQVMLVLGSLLFSLPLVWLVLTSLRDSDELGRNGAVVGLPTVPVMQMYKDPIWPAYSVEFENQRVRVDTVETYPDGTALVEVQEPKVWLGRTFVADRSKMTEVPRPVPNVRLKSGEIGLVAQEFPDGKKRVVVSGQSRMLKDTDFTPVVKNGFKWENYTEVLSYLPRATLFGLLYLKNTLLLGFLNVIGTLLSSSLVAYGFARFQFPGKNALFILLLSTMMLPGAVTLLPGFLIFKSLGWIDTLKPLWVPAFFGSAFNIFLLRQFFDRIPKELDEAAEIDGCSPVRVYWSILLPQLHPILITLALTTFMGQWNGFQGALIYTNSVENMPIAYGLQLFMGDRSGEPALLMAASVIVLAPILILFFATQKYFMEKISLGGLGGK